MKKKAIIFDLDGTAIDSPANQLPSARLVKALEKLQKNYYLCAATGRCWSYGKDVMQALGLTDPCVITAGSQICDPKTGAVLWQKNIDPADTIKVIEVFRLLPEANMLFNDYTLEDYTDKRYVVKDFNFDGEVFFLELVDIEARAAEKIAKQLEEINGVACLVLVAQDDLSRRDIHVMHVGATKEQAIGELLKMMGVEQKDTIGVGDGGNDFHLFNAVGTKIAMGNAATALKAQADLVIGPVKEDGLAVYLEGLVDEV